MKFREIFGFPASGKTFFMSKLMSYKKNVYSLEEMFFTEFFFIPFSLNKFLYKALFLFSKKKFFDSVFQHYIMKKKNNFILNLQKTINFNFIKFEKEHKIFCETYLNLIELTTYSGDRKHRNVERFRYFIGMYHYINVKKKYRNNIIIQDEGFYQKIFLDYKNNDHKTIFEVKKYLKHIPKVDKVYFIDESIDICINRMNKRKKYFNFQNDNLGKKVFLNIKKIIDIEKKKNFIIIQ